MTIKEKPIYEELFDLKNDPKEHHNLAKDSKYLDILNFYRSRCKTLVNELN